MSKLGTFKACTCAVPRGGFAINVPGLRQSLHRTARAVKQTLAFCDHNQQIIPTWFPSSRFAQVGAPLITRDRHGVLKDLLVLNQSDHAVQVTGVRFVTDTPDVALFSVANGIFSVAAGQCTALVIEYQAGPAPSALTGMVEELGDDPIDSIARIRFSASVVANRHAELQGDPSSLDFGTAVVGSSVEQTINFKNIGSHRAALTLDIPPGPFSLHPLTALDPGQTAAVEVKFQPTARGERSLTLGIELQSQTDVAGVQHHQRYEIPLAGKAIAPVIFLAAGPQPVVRPPVGGLPHGPRRELELELLDFGSAAPDQSVDKSFWIRNHGDAPLTVLGVVSQTSGNFGVSTQRTFPFTLQPGSEMEVPCSFRASPVPGRSEGGRLRITSDDPLRNSTDLPVKGKAGGPSLTRLDLAGVPTERDALDLGNVPPSHSANITFRSNGTAPVVLRLITMPANEGFSLAAGIPAPLPILAPAQELTLTVTLTADPGPYRAQLILNYGIRLLHVDLSAVVT